MELRDFIVTPITLIIVFLLAYFFRPKFTDHTNRKYFIPAFTAKVFGAIALGFLYQFYYTGGDTFNFHTYGSRHIWEGFIDSPDVGVDIFFSNSAHNASSYKYSSKILFFKDPNSFMIVRIAAFFDLFTFSAYSATAVFFSCISFIGGWSLFLTFYRRHPHAHFFLALACLFIPSVVFWGSGILKDTIVLACLGLITYEIDQLFMLKRISVFHVIILVVSICFVFMIKKFILQAFLPSVLLWIYLSNVQKIHSVVARAMIVPILFLFLLAGAYYSAAKVGEGDSRYSLDKVAETAKTTAYDIRYWTGKDAGSGYSLGELDGSFSSMLRLAPAAINASLFRPYLWEVRNPLMIMAAVEGLIFFFAVSFLIIKAKVRFFVLFTKPDIAFCLSFALVYSFAVGVSTFNFGTLSRYKVSMLPFFALGLVIIYSQQFFKNVANSKEK